MRSTVVLKVFAVLVVVAGVQQVVGRPYRMKRTSDQHMANRESQVALKNLKAIAVTVPLASGLVDPLKVGRKRRSQSRLFDALFNRSSEEEDVGNRELELDDLLTVYKMSLL